MCRFKSSKAGGESGEYMTSHHLNRFEQAFGPVNQEYYFYKGTLQTIGSNQKVSALIDADKKRRVRFSVHRLRLQQNVDQSLSSELCLRFFKVYHVILGYCCNNNRASPVSRLSLLVCYINKSRCAHRQMPL